MEITFTLQAHYDIAQACNKNYLRFLLLYKKKRNMQYLLQHSTIYVKSNILDEPSFFVIFVFGTLKKNF